MRRRTYINEDNSNQYSLCVAFIQSDETLFDWEILFNSRNSTEIYYISGYNNEKTKLTKQSRYKLSDLYKNYTYFEIYMEFDMTIELEITLFSSDNIIGEDIKEYHLECYTTPQDRNQRFEYTINKDEGFVKI